MNGALDAMGHWLADFQLLAFALLGGVAVALAAMHQPARRLAVVRATLAGLAVLAVLCALPGWSLVHLLSADQDSVAAPIVVDRSNVSQVGAAPMARGDDAERWQGHASISIGGAKPQVAVVDLAQEVNWGRWASIVYLSGSLAVVIWLACGSVMAGRVRRDAAPASEVLRSLLQQIVGAERTPELLVSDRVGTAAALGLWRPTIILSRELSGGEPAAVLAHEWAHIRQGDLWTLAVSRLMLVLVWPQPMYWLVRRWMRLDQETLADAAAVAVTERVDYAQQLLGWAQRAAAAGTRGRSPRLAGAVGLWEGPSELKLRVAALLDEKFNLLRECSQRWRVGSACLLLVAAGGLSLVTLQRGEQRATAAAPEPSAANAPAASATPANAIAGAPVEVMEKMRAAFSKFKQTPNVVVGACLDGEGQRIAGAEVTLYRCVLGADRRAPQQVATQTTDEAGQFRFENVVDAAKEFPNGPPDELFQSNVVMLGVLAHAPGKAFDGESVLAATALKQGAIWIMSLKPAATLRGRVTDADGNSVADASVTVGYEPLPGLGLNTAQTDAEGRYSIENLTSWDAEATRKWFEAERTRQEQAGTTDGWLATSASGPGEPPRTLLTVRHPDFAAKLVEVAKIPGEADVQLAPGAVLEGRVVFTEEGQSRPASDVVVTIVHQAPAMGADGPTPSYMLMRQESTRTDVDGRYRVTSLPPGKFMITSAANDWVTNGLPDVEASRGQVVQAPELSLTRGALVRLQLVDAETDMPLELKGMQRAYVNPTRLPVGEYQWPVLTDNVIKVNSTGESKVRVPPGRYVFFVTMPESDWQHPFWTTADMGNLNEAKGATVGEGDMASVTVRMRKQDPAQQTTASFIVGGGPPADTDAKTDQGDRADAKADGPVAPKDPWTDFKPRPEKFVRIVVGPGGEMTYQGEKTTWDALPAILEKTPLRDKTVLEIAIASDEMSVRESNDAQALAFGLADRFKFRYGSYVGVHPLGSKGTAVDAE